MNFTEVVAEVLSIVKRPDKLADIRRVVNATVSQSCIGTSFARDLQERSIVIDPAAYAQNIALSEFSRFRKFQYIKPSNRNIYINPLGPERIFAQVKQGNSVSDVELLDKYYVAGDQVNFKLCQAAPSLLVGWFAYPPVLTDAAPTFWLLDVAPYMIIDGAAGKLFKSIGDDQSAAKHETEYRLAYLQAIQDLRYGVHHG